ncbi:MAG: hypothetical protein ACW99J_19870, partial [Candidatus Thorarchaeota archaeon]
MESTAFAHIEKVELYSLVDSVLTSTTVLKAEGPLLAPWLEIYNFAAKRHPKSASLTIDDVHGLLDAEQIDPASLLLEMSRAGPIAATRLVINQETRNGHILDLAITPSRKKSGIGLIDYILETSRDLGLQKLESWIPDHMSTSADLLARFTFEPRQFRSRMRNLLVRKPELGSGVSTKKVPLEPRRLQVKEHLQIAELHELAPERWRPVVGLVHKDEPEVEVVGYQSLEVPARGYLRIDEKGIIEPNNVSLIANNALHH